MVHCTILWERVHHTKAWEVKNKLIFRKDIKIDTNRLCRLCVQAGQLVEQHKKDSTKLEVLEVMYSRELEELEAHLITNGLFFEWIKEGSTYIGILVLENELSALPSYLEPFANYTPDVQVSNLKEVQQEHIKKMKEARQKN